MSAPPLPKPLTEFTLFPKLPIEMRLLIWAFAAPAPATIAQRRSHVGSMKIKYWTYLERAGGVPALLHACRESRAEYLEGEDEKATITRRRMHPLYKLLLILGSEQRGGAYISTDIDSFWPENRVLMNDPIVDRARGIYHSSYRGISEWKIASKLKHFVVTQKSESIALMTKHDLHHLLASFPCLETLTVLIEEKHVRNVFMDGSLATPVVYNPEVDEQLTEIGMSTPHLTAVNWSKTGTLFREWKRLKDNSPDKFPDLRYRFERQFIRAENLNIPELVGTPEAAVETNRAQG